MPEHPRTVLAGFWRAGVELLRALPPRARWWWLAVVLVSAMLAPVCLWLPTELALPPALLGLAAALNGLLVMASAPRRSKPTLGPSFDYGGIATLALLASVGPGAALCAFAGEKIAAAFLPDATGHRPPWFKSVFNLAWGSPCILFSWSMRGLAPSATLEPMVVAAAWCFGNGMLVGTMVALAQRRSLRDAVRLAVTYEGWLRAQEGALSVLAVVVFWVNPLLLGAVVLLVIGQAATGRKLFREYEQREIEATHARLDALTGLPNRRAFEEASQRVPAPRAVLMLDLDHFKRINDTFGHEVGDRVLAGVAAAMQRTLGGSAFCARLGGEEFCALFGGAMTDDELLVVASQVRSAVSELRVEGHESLRVSASIGIARRAAHEGSVRAAMARADQALYRAKRDGRDRAYLESKGPHRLAS